MGRQEGGARACLQPRHDIAESARKGPGDEGDLVIGGDDAREGGDDGEAGADG